MGERVSVGQERENVLVLVQDQVTSTELVLFLRMRLEAKVEAFSSLDNFLTEMMANRIELEDYYSRPKKDRKDREEHRLAREAQKLDDFFTHIHAVIADADLLLTQEGRNTLRDLAGNTAVSMLFLSQGELSEDHYALVADYEYADVVFLPTEASEFLQKLVALETTIEHQIKESEKDITLL